MTEPQKLTLTLAPGELVLVIGIDADAPASWPRPGSIGDVFLPCFCKLLTERCEGYKVRFSGNRTGCYSRPQLRRLGPEEPIGDETETEKPREVTA